MEQRFDVASLSKIVGLVGLPRSGTTMLNSVLAVHSRIEGIYEPWNRDEDDERAPGSANIQEIFARFLPHGQPSKDIVIIKETATHVRFLDFMAALLRSVEPPMQTDLIVLWRNPLHVFLSEIEARQRWWDGASVDISAGEFDRWAGPRLGGLWRMLEIGCQLEAVAVPYEGLVADKARAIPAMMDKLGIDFEPAQLSFERYLDRSRVRGDITVATKPSPISKRRVRRRERELREVLEKIKEAASFPYVSSVAEILTRAERWGLRALLIPRSMTLLVH